MRTAIQSLEIIKEMYEYFVKKYRELEPNLMICEKEDFDNVFEKIRIVEQLENNNVNLRDIQSVMFSRLGKIVRLVGIINRNCSISLSEEIMQCGGNKIAFYFLNIAYAHNHIKLPIEKEDYELLKEIQK